MNYDELLDEIFFSQVANKRRLFVSQCLPHFTCNNTWNRCKELSNAPKYVTRIGIMETIDLFAVEIYGDGSFYPGEVIYGDVYLKTNEELTLREIRVEFYGEAKVYWTEAARSGRRKRLGMRDYTNYEQYLNIAATVYGKGKPLLHSVGSFFGI